jgi:hypothetical protein
MDGGFGHQGLEEIDRAAKTGLGITGSLSAGRATALGMSILKTTIGRGRHGG